MIIVSDWNKNPKLLNLETVGDNSHQYLVRNQSMLSLLRKLYSMWHHKTKQMRKLTEIEEENKLASQIHVFKSRLSKMTQSRVDHHKSYAYKTYVLNNRNKFETLVIVNSKEYN